MRLILLLFIVLLTISCKKEIAPPVEMKIDVVTLASDEFAGRETGTIGERLAAEYIAKRFEEIGLETIDSDSYYQDFSFKPSVNPHEKAEFVDGEGEVVGRNVVGYINNGAENTVVIGAHYDHLGMGGTSSLYREGEAIHNGADDNASGVAVMMNLAYKLASQRKSSANSNNYVFIAFSGEEMGLLGSAYFVKNAPIDVESITYMINMDMVGRLNNENVLAIHGVGTSPIIKQTLFANNQYGFTLAEHESGIGPSDHTSFYLADIPVIHFFTGQHEDYHKPGDDSEKLNYEGMTLISNYIFDIITDLDDKGKLAFRKTKDESEEVPRFEVALGVVPDYLYTGKGMRIDGVSEDKPAQKAGLQKGDIVVKMGDSTIVDMMSYMKTLATFKKEQTTKVTVERDGAMVEVEVTF